MIFRDSSAKFYSLVCTQLLPRLPVGMTFNNIWPLKLLGSLYLNDTHKIQTLSTLYIAHLLPRLAVQSRQQTCS